jgi:hypothetical protein
MANEIKATIITHLVMIIIIDDTLSNHEFYFTIT